MKNEFPGELWKAIKFDFEFTNDGRIEVSNLGRLRTEMDDAGRKL